MLNIKQINTKITDYVFLGSFYIEIMENRWFVAKKVYSVQFVPLLIIHNGIKEELQ